MVFDVVQENGFDSRRDARDFFRFKPDVDDGGRGLSPIQKNQSFKIGVTGDQYPLFTYGERENINIGRARGEVVYRSSYIVTTGRQ
jgi:hypothetical protein